MLALLTITLLWAGIIRPVGDALASARGRHADAVIRLGRVESAVDAVKTMQRAGIAPLSSPLADAVRARAEAAGFALTSLDQDGPDQIRIAIPTARPGALFAWIAALEQDGIIALDVSVTSNGDRTVGARMTLRARSA